MLFLKSVLFPLFYSCIAACLRLRFKTEVLKGSLSKFHYSCRQNIVLIAINVVPKNVLSRWEKSFTEKYLKNRKAQKRGSNTNKFLWKLTNIWNYFQLCTATPTARVQHPFKTTLKCTCCEFWNNKFQSFFHNWVILGVQSEKKKILPNRSNWLKNQDYFPFASQTENLGIIRFPGNLVQHPRNVGFVFLHFYAPWCIYVGQWVSSA